MTVVVRILTCLFVIGMLQNPVFAYNEEANSTPVSSGLVENSQPAFRTESEVSVKQIIVVFVFLFVLLALAIFLLVLTQRRPELLKRSQVAGSAVQVIETRRVSPRLTLVVVRVHSSTIMIVDNGSMIQTINIDHDTSDE